MAQILTQVSQVSKSLNDESNDIGFQSKLLEQSLNETDQLISPILKKLIHQYIDKSIWDELEYSLINKAHFDRAFFVKIGCESVDGNFYKVLPAMASVEFRYASGTAIDDVFDANDERMGKASMPIKYGQNPALSLAAILKSLSSIALLSNFKDLNIDPESFIDINIKDEYTHYQVYLGQLADLKSENLEIDEITDSFYLDMIKNSTGVDAGYCFELGCVLGGGSKEQQKSLYEFGVALGTAMQVRDDLLDYVNNSELINKEPFRDFETKKKRLPIIIAYRFGNKNDKETIQYLLKKEELNADDKIKLSSLISDDFVLGYINKLKKELLQTAISSFHKVNASKNSKVIIDQIIQQIDG
ncbi:MAG: polyprenyl synthetase family protein [Candidatus Marinimicrobia bacterium]|nr:polyprenyl synthetase family protein [Candidatus Neomarinimicrobiota bacterium]